MKKKTDENLIVGMLISHADEGCLVCLNAVDHVRRLVAKQKGIKVKEPRPVHALAGRAEYRDNSGCLPHSDSCRSNRMGPCDCGRGY